MVLLRFVKLHRSLLIPHSGDNFRIGGPEDAMVGRWKRSVSADKLGSLMATVAESARIRYRSGWANRNDFCSGVGISPRRDPPRAGWCGIIILDPPTWGYNVMDVGYAAPRARYAAIRFTHLAKRCGPVMASFRVRSSPHAIRRLNPAIENVHVAVGILRRAKTHFFGDSMEGPFEFGQR